jgi:hypothetical protein
MFECISNFDLIKCRAGAEVPERANSERDYRHLVSIGTEKLTLEQQQQPTEPESLLPTSTDYSSYKQQSRGGQYGDQQQNAQQQQQQ